MERAGFALFLLAYIQPAQSLPSGDVFKYIPQREARQQVHEVCTNATTTAIDRCGEKKLFHLLINPFPWCAASQIHDSWLDKYTTNTRHVGQTQDDVEDPMDCMNYSCGVFDEFQHCLSQKNIPEVCMLSDQQFVFRAYTDINFVCHRQKRGTNLINALQCIKRSRDLELLLYRMVERHGPRFVDPYAQGSKNAFWRFLNAESLMYTFRITPRNVEWFLNFGLVCFPMNVLLHEINAIISRSCGDLATRMVTEYFVYFRNKFNAILKDAGLPSAICDPDEDIISRNTVSRKTKHMDEQSENSGEFHTELVNFLEENSDGTALDTLYGRHLLYGIKDMPEQNLCQPFLAYGISDLLTGCFMLAQERSTKGIFNILHFAHDQRLPFMDYPQTTAMKRLQICVNLIGNMCGKNYTNYVNLYYVVVHGAAEIQTMMDNLTCEWQGTLIRGYMQAAEAGNEWPTLMNMVGRPLFLTSGWYNPGDLVKALQNLWDHVRAGMPGISTRCGMEAASRIEIFYDKLIYAWYNFVNYLSRLPLS